MTCYQQTNDFIADMLQVYVYLIMTPMDHVTEDIQ